jgi:hypothetical protein
MHWQLGEYGVRKRYHAGFDPEQAAALAQQVAEGVAAHPAGAGCGLLQPVQGAPGQAGG